MLDLFVPPQGAMQFERSHPTTILHNEPVFWVQGKYRSARNIIGCQCTWSYYVLRDGLSQENKRIYDDFLKNTGKHLGMCGCMGHIIE